MRLLVLEPTETTTTETLVLLACTMDTTMWTTSSRLYEQYCTAGSRSVGMLYWDY